MIKKPRFLMRTNSMTAQTEMEIGEVRNELMKIHKEGLLPFTRQKSKP